MSRNSSGFGDVLWAIAQAGLVLGTAYMSEKIEEEKMDQLLALPQQDALVVIARSVPPMDNTVWQQFQSRLQRRAVYSDEAKLLLYFAQCIVRAEHEVQQLLQYSMSDAIEIIASLLPNKDDFERLALLVGLQSSNNVKARAILGRMLNG
ncbi:MAG: hypothetical protein OHK0022_57500 [Roseiflexaceae bacterium]